MNPDDVTVRLGDTTQPRSHLAVSLAFVMTQPFKLSVYLDDTVVSGSYEACVITHLYLCILLFYYSLMHIFDHIFYYCIVSLFYSFHVHICVV